MSPQSMSFLIEHIYVTFYRKSGRADLSSWSPTSFSNSFACFSIMARPIRFRIVDLLTILKTWYFLNHTQLLFPIEFLPYQDPSGRSNHMRSLPKHLESEIFVPSFCAFIMPLDGYSNYIFFTVSHLFTCYCAHWTLSSSRLRMLSYS